MRSLKSQAWIPEVYAAMHRSDTVAEPRFDYERNLLRKSTSVTLWQNPTLASFMNGLNAMVVHLVASVSVVRNRINLNADRYSTNATD